MVTRDKILIAQNKWAQGLIAIGKLSDNPDEALKLAHTVIDDLYNYEDQVLFKPTTATDTPFRSSLEGALSYFVGQNPNFTEDHGFALKPWVDVQFKNEGFIFGDIMAISMGQCELTSKGGAKTLLQYTFGYKVDDNNQLKVALHHSSLPYR